MGELTAVDFATVDFAIVWSILLALLLLIGYVVLTGPRRRR